MGDGNYIDLVLIHENGETKIVVENGPAIKCSDLASDEIIKKFLSQAVPGFGTPQIDEQGHTSEYYSEHKPNLSIQQTNSSDQTFIQKRREQEEKGKRQQHDL